jgi:hypothetical protein
LLAVAVAAGIEHEFEYLTVGPPNWPDVIVATELAQRFALDHRVEFLERFDSTSFVERAAAFVAATSGMVNAFDTRPVTLEHQLSVTGVCGELLRASEFVPGGLSSREQLTHHLRQDRFNKLGLVRKEAFERLHAELLHATFDPPDAVGLEPLDLLQRHCVIERMRLVRLGPAIEPGESPTARPLNSPVAARAAMSIGADLRQADVFVAELMRRTCPDLLDHRFAGSRGILASSPTLQIAGTTSAMNRWTRPPHHRRPRLRRSNRATRLRRSSPC